MKLKQNFVIREIAGDVILIPIISKADSFHGIITLNETGKFIFEQLQKEMEFDRIIENMMEEYDVDKEKATFDVRFFINKLKGINLIDEN